MCEPMRLLKRPLHKLFDSPARQPVAASPNHRAKASQAALDAPAPGVRPTGARHGSLYRAGVTLAQLQPGECGTVRGFRGPAHNRLRLLEMGLTPGTHIKVIRAAAFGGPLDISVRGYQLSLRRDEAESVWLDDEDSEL